MKKISVLLPCFNEENNVIPIAEAVTEVMDKFTKYEYEIIFRDNASTDGTLTRLREIAAKNKKVKVIVNCRNYGVFPDRNTFLGRVDGDVVIAMACDFQDPPELIPQLVEWYEKGFNVVVGVKTDSKEGRIKYSLRQVYYRIICGLSDMPRISNMGIVLATRSIMEMYWRGYKYQTFDNFMADLGIETRTVPYTQGKRANEKSSYNVWRYFGYSINSLVQTSVKPIRIATILGSILSFCSFCVGVVYLILKVFKWYMYPAGQTPLLIGMFFLGSIQLLFVGLVGEYVGQIFKIVMPDNPAIVKELINYPNDVDKTLLTPSEDVER